MKQQLQLGSDLLIADPQKIEEAFSKKDGLSDFLNKASEKIKAEARAINPDMSKAVNRKALRSLAARVSN